MLHHVHATGSRDIQNGWVLSGQASYILGFRRSLFRKHYFEGFLSKTHSAKEEVMHIYKTVWIEREIFKPLNQICNETTNKSVLVTTKYR